MPAVRPASAGIAATAVAAPQQQSQVQDGYPPSLREYITRCFGPMASYNETEKQEVQVCMGLEVCAAAEIHSQSSIAS